MNKTLVLSAFAIALLGSAAVLAQGQPQQPQQPMSFFVTSATPTGTGNLGGLAGADKICQDLAAAAGAGHKRVPTNPRSTRAGVLDKAHGSIKRAK
jgi:hypothetical protein